MTKPRLLTPPRLWALMTGALVFVLGTFVLIYWLLLDYRQSHREIFDRLANETESVTMEMRTVMAALNAQPDQTCTDAILKKMHQQLFLADHIRDIGFLVGRNLVCSTGIGRLPEPVDAGDPDFIGELGLEVQTLKTLLLFDGEYKALIVRSDRFNAVYDLEDLRDLLDTDFDWQLVALAEDQPYTIGGQPGLYRAGADGYTLSLSNQRHQACLETMPYCITTVSTLNHWFDQYRKLLFASLLLVLLLSLLTAQFVQQRIERHRSIEARVIRGLKKQQFYCLFQPIVDLNNGRVVGCEALARYRSDEVALYPDQFIPQITKLGKTWPFTRYLVETSLAELDRQTDLPDGFKVNFNLFPNDIDSGKTRALTPYANHRFRIFLEITEDQHLEGASAQSELVWLRQQGFGIALDDFGTGYSNLNQIRDLHCDTLKIDRSFITDVEDGSIKSTLIPYIVNIAKDLDLDVVAEGVENRRQAEELREMGVEYAQGWAFGKPMSAQDLARLYVELRHR